MSQHHLLLAVQFSNVLPTELQLYRTSTELFTNFYSIEGKATCGNNRPHLINISFIKKENVCVRVCVHWLSCTCWDCGELASVYHLHLCLCDIYIVQQKHLLSVKKLTLKHSVCLNCIKVVFGLSSASATRSVLT